MRRTRWSVTSRVCPPMTEEVFDADAGALRSGLRNFSALRPAR